MNILSESELHHCTSCQMCAAICPVSAIKIELDDDGFYRPFVDDKCINCGKCVEACFKFDDNVVLTSEEELSQVNHYAAFAKDISVVNETTSGGVADILARHLVSMGYKVIGVVYDSTLDTAVHKVANDVEGVLQFRGSKYIQSYSLDALRELVMQCKYQQYAFFGLPCQIFAVNRFLENNNLRQQCILVDLYCHGCPSMFVWKKVVNHIHQCIGRGPFSSVNFRSKKAGWGKFVLEVKGEGGVEYNSTPLNNEFYDLFFSNQLLNQSCTECLLRSTLHYTDIRLGDYWGKEYRKNKKGVSGVTLVTQIGKKVFGEISTNLQFEIRHCDDFLPYQSWGIKYQVNQELRSKLLAMLKNPNTTIHNVVAPIRKKMTLITRIKRIIKEILFSIYVVKGKFFTKTR